MRRFSRLQVHGRRLATVLLVLALPSAQLAPVLAFEEPADGTVTVYQPGGLEPAVTSAAIDAASRTGAAWVPIHTGTLKLLRVTRGEDIVQEAPPGFRIPMSMMAVDANRASAIVGRPVATALGRGMAVMGAASADLRGALPGDEIEFIGWDGNVHTRKLGLVVPDELINWAELAFDADDAATFGFERISSLVLWDMEHRDETVIELWRTLPQIRLRVDSSDDPWNPDSTLPTVLIKQRFGEFSYRETGNGDQIVMDSAWRNANIIDVDLPLLGPFRCHRLTAPLIEGVVDAIIEAGLASEVSFADFQLAGGCWNPRLIRGGDKGGALSRHAWGVAIDVNPSENPYGGVVDMHPEIVEIFRSWGFAWGGGWTFTDGAHFEWNHAVGSTEAPPELAGS